MQGQQQHQEQSFAQKVNAIVCIAQYASMVCEVFVRVPGTWGKRHASMHMMVSWVVMFVFGPVLFREYDPRPMFGLWCFTTFLLVMHGFARRSEEAKGYRCHSLYTGRSIFTCICGSDATAKTLFEPAAFALVGYIAGHFSPPMGAYFFVVAVGTFINNGWMVQEEQARLQAAEDAWHDAQTMQHGLQNRMGE